jgi:hypothetical protein
LKLPRSENGIGYTITPLLSLLLPATIRIGAKEPEHTWLQMGRLKSSDIRTKRDAQNGASCRVHRNLAVIGSAGQLQS